MRPSGRLPHQLRSVSIVLDYLPSAEGSALIRYGNTQVLCTATVVKGVPRWMKEQGLSQQGWLTAEYGMLPRSTQQRMEREAVRGKQTGRTQEIQRLIGRSLRACVDLTQMGEYTVTLDCDVIQADGGTRTAAITGACVALVSALRFMQRQRWIKTDPFKGFVAAVSVGLYEGEAVLDLDYAEDSAAQTDMNVVLAEGGGLIEIQSTAEKGTFTEAQFNQMLDLAKSGIQCLFEEQKRALN